MMSNWSKLARLSQKTLTVIFILVYMYVFIVLTESVCLISEMGSIKGE